jgi:DNA-binding CsgD family transcriptional regulator
VVWRAADRLGIGRNAVAPSEAAGLIERGGQVRFRHPLIRSAVYRSATSAELREAHRALADATDAAVDPERRAWHRARAVVGTDEAVAAELERAAARAVSAGGPAAAGALLQAAAPLSPDPARRAQRSLEAAEAKATAGAFEDAAVLLAAASGGPIGEAERARIDLLRAQIAYTANNPAESLPAFLAAARRFEAIDPTLARRTYLDALAVALFLGHHGPQGGLAVRQAAEAVRAMRPPESSGKADLLLDGMAVLYTDGYVAAAPLLRRAVQAFGREEFTPDDALRGAWIAILAAIKLWDDEHWELLSRRHLDVVRRAGALGLLPRALGTRALLEAHRGQLAVAASLIAERRWLDEVSGGGHRPTPIPEAWLAALQGREEPAQRLIQDGLDAATARGQGADVTLLYSARAVLCNGLGRYEEALAAAREAASDPQELNPTHWALSELVEAGMRAGHADAAAEGFEQLSSMTSASGTQLALGIEASCAALLRGDAGAEELYREGIQRLGSTGIRLELGRARLRYGEWLRRRGRRVDARDQLRTAHDDLAGMGLEAFANRARRELLATGETVRKRSAEPPEALTAQEATIAGLAAQGLTNPEIAAQLYLSPRTVEWHLRKVFTKVGVSTRKQLRRSRQEA